MRVSNVASVYEIYQTSRASNVSRMSRAEEKKDFVALSSHAKDYQIAAKAVREVPDVRLGRIAEIQNKIESNSYAVNSNDVAGKILSLV